MSQVYTAANPFTPPPREPVSELIKLYSRKRTLKQARDSLLTFAKLMMPDPSCPWDIDRSLYHVAPHHQAIARVLERVESGATKRAIIAAPPRHGKSQLAAKLFTAWCAGRKPQNSLILGTYSDDMASGFGNDVRAIIESIDYQKVFPDTGLQPRKKGTAHMQMSDPWKGDLYFVGRSGAITGRGGHIIILDDPIKNEDEARSPTIRNKLWDWYTRVILSRLMDENAAIIIIQTRWHEDDLIGRLTDPQNDHYDPDEAAEWDVLNLPALSDGDGDPLGRAQGQALWPDRFGTEFLNKQRRVDPTGFHALYQGRPTPEEGTFFKKDMFQFYRPQDKPENLRYYCASDHAVSTAQGSDRTCLIPVGVDDNDDIYVMPDVYWQLATTDQAVEAMINLMAKYKPLFWWAEKSHITKSIGPFLRKRMLERDTFCTVLEMNPSADKQTRAQSIHARMSMRKVFFPVATPWWTHAKDEFLKFPNGPKDDFVDGLAFIGLGLAALTGASAPKRRRDTAPKTGTMGWVKSETRRQEAERQMAHNQGW